MDIQRKSNEFIQRCRERRQNNTNSYTVQGVIDRQSFEVDDRENVQPPSTEYKDQYQPKQMLQEARPSGYKSSYTRFLGGSNETSVKDLPKFTPSQMHRAQYERQAQSNAHVEYENDETMRSNMSKSGRKKSHMINDILK